MEEFELVSKITDVQTIAKGHGIKVLSFLVKRYGGKSTSWRKKKGKGIIRQSGILYVAELHWFEAHGIGRVNMKIKRKRKI
jgi:hypothetical protein